MGSLNYNKHHAVLLPYPAQGHINPFMQLAKLLYLKGFHITFVNTEFNHKRLIRSNGPGFMENFSGFRFETIPDGLPPSERDATQDIWALSDSVQKNCLGPFRELLGRLNSTIEVPPVSCVICDGLMTFGIEAARELGIVDVMFWTASTVGLSGFLYFRDLVDKSIIPFKDNDFMDDGSIDMPLNWINDGIKNLRLKDMPTLIRTTDPQDIMLRFMMNESERGLKSSAILFNTFDKLEHDVLKAIKAQNPNIYSIGPLFMIQPSTLPKSLKSNLWKEDKTCFEWLEKQKPNSVIYVNYGSITVMTNEQFQELAWGLANSKCPFLWVVRSDVVMGSSGYLPDEYYREIENRGFIVSWCKQEEVLSHRAIGAFLTHGGWNSTLEGLCNGVPMLCWPFFDEQPMNCRYLCNEWGVAMEISHKVRREEIENLVKEIMEGKKGKEMKKKAMEWKKKAEEAASTIGSSYNDFEAFLYQSLNFRGY